MIYKKFGIRILLENGGLQTQMIKPSLGRIRMATKLDGLLKKVGKSKMLVIHKISVTMRISLMNLIKLTVSMFMKTNQNTATVSKYKVTSNTVIKKQQQRSISKTMLIITQTSL